jgi:ADP-heptose:LPS heptosyltransferase
VAALPAIERGLVVRRGGLGDTLLMLPILRALRRAAPRAELHLAGVREFAEVLVDAGAAARAISSEDLGLWSLHGHDASRGAATRGRLGQYAWIVADDPAVAAAAMGSGARVQAFDPRRLDGSAPFARQIAAQLDLELHWPRDAWLADAARTPLPDAPIVLAPGSGGHGKCWPREGWHALAARLAAEGRALRVLFGPAELERDDVRAWSWPAAVGFVDGVPAIGLATSLRACAAYVGNDSGPSHLAAMLGVPTVAVFGPTDPKVWTPQGPRVRVVGGDGRALRDVAVDEVVGALDAVRAAAP